jgi:hypothetical protein
MILREENRRNQRKASPSSTFSTINPSYIGLESNQDLYGDMPTGNCLIGQHIPTFLLCVQFSVSFPEVISVPKLLDLRVGSEKGGGKVLRNTISRRVTERRYAL